MIITTKLNTKHMRNIAYNGRNYMQLPNFKTARNFINSTKL
jgi:hypothetical protein